VRKSAANIRPLGGPDQMDKKAKTPKKPKQVKSKDAKAK
jgi:hypothetical protein